MWKLGLITFFIFLSACPTSGQEASLTDRLAGETKPITIPLGAISVSEAHSLGPKLHDGSKFMKIPIGEGEEVSGKTVSVRIDGKAMLPVDYAIMKNPGASEYVVYFLKDVPAGTAVEVGYRTSKTQAATIAKTFLGTPGQSLVGNSASMPVKFYWGQETSTTAGVAATAWRKLAAYEGMKQTGRMEYGFGISGFKYKGVELTYGQVVNQSGGEGSYRDEFIQNYLAGNATAGVRSALAPEGTARDVRWSGIKYGDPAKDSVWFTQSKLRMDQNYSPVATSGAATDLSVFLSDASKWGGRSLVSPWWSGYYADAWKNLEGTGKQGRTGVGAFAGWELAYTGYGFRAKDYFSYSKGTFSQEQLSSHQKMTEGEEKMEFHAPTGTDVSWSQSTLETSRPGSGTTSSSDLVSSSDPGENSSTKHETLSLTQRLSRGQNGPVVSVTQHQWSQLNKLSGIESPTVRDRTTSISGVSLFGRVDVDYQNVRNESEDFSFDAMETHRLNFNNLRIINPFVINGSFGVISTDKQGVKYIDNTLTMPGFRIFEGISISGVKYQRLRDVNGATSSQQTIGFGGAFLGGQWDLSYDRLAMDEGFVGNTTSSINPYGQTFDRRATSFSYQKSIPSTGTELRAGWTQGTLNGNSLGQTYRVAASQLVKPGLGLGNFIIQGAQYRHVDTWGVMRPSYSWAIRYDNGPKLQAAMLGFEHYGAGDEMSFVSRTALIKSTLGPFALAATWRTNPLLNESGGRAQPFLWRGESKEYSLVGQVNSRMNISVSLAQNALPPGYVVEAGDWGSVAFSGPQSSALRPTTWSWQENWGTRYSVSYDLGKANITIVRSRTRFNQTAASLVAWTADLNWQMSQSESLAVGLRSWRGEGGQYGSPLTAGDLGHPIGLAFSLRYSRDYGSGRKISIIFVDAGPLSSFWGQNNAWGQEASGFVGSLPYADYPHTKLYLEYSSPF